MRAIQGMKKRKQSKTPQNVNTIAEKPEIVKISKGPSEIREWIRLMNLLPKDKNAYQDAVKELSVLFNKAPLENIDTCNRRFRGFIGSELADKLSLEKFGFLNAHMAIDRLYSDKATLLAIIFAFRQWDVDYNRQVLLAPTFGLPDAPLAISFNADTSINIPILECLAKTFRVERKGTMRVPIERIRQCPECQNIYWASRLDAETCGTPACAEKHSRKKEKE
jgi:hypothetical protein